MKQYLELLQTIKDKGTHKPAARAGMPGTTSLFGYQLRHDLSEGFPLITTKKMYWKGVVVELLWFLRGDTNIKYLLDNGVNIWNEDAYNYYLKLGDIIGKDHVRETGKEPRPFTFAEFVDRVRTHGDMQFFRDNRNGYSYKLGDCGHQYGKVWRDWNHSENIIPNAKVNLRENVDQIKNIFNSLRKNPESRRHIVTAIDPAHDTDLALYWCHAMFQFNCKPLTLDQRFKIWFDTNKPNRDVVDHFDDLIPSEQTRFLNERGISKYYLDCQLYQRSADVVLGVPFNIASYALLTHIIAKLCNMVPGEFIHTFGDVHIYDNHMDAVNEQLTREPRELPKLVMIDNPDETVWADAGHHLDFSQFEYSDFTLEGYNPYPKLESETKLSTGLK